LFPKSLWFDTWTPENLLLRDNLHLGLHTQVVNKRLEGQLDRLVDELNRMEEEELQSQLMAERHYMIDEDDSSNHHHEHVQATTTLGSEEVVE